MAGIKWTTVAPPLGEAAITTGTSRKTILQLIANSAREEVRAWGISFDDPTVSVYVELIRQNDGPGGTAADVVKDLGCDAETLAGTAKYDLDGSVQPDDAAILWHGWVSGGVSFLLGSEDAILLQGGSRLGIAITSPSDIGVAAYLKGQE